MLRPRGPLLIFTGLVPLAPPLLARVQVCGSTTVNPVVVECLQWGGSA